MQLNLKLMFSIFLLMVTIFLGGCSTVITGKTQSVTFQSSPSGATVTINGAPIGTTPLTTLIERKSGQSLTITKEGYKPFSTSMTTSLNPWFWGNILIGGVLGSTTDGLTGSMHQYAPSQFMVTLEPDGSSKVNAATEKTAKDKAREFIILSYNPLMADIAKGNGNYLNSLINTLEVPEGEEAEAIKRIKSLSETFSDIAKFADQTVSAFLK